MIARIAVTNITQPSPDQERTDIRDNDTVAALFLNYFCLCITMREHAQHLWKCHDAIEDAHARALFAQCRLSPYLRAWQASLYPVITGFKKLGLRDERVDLVIYHHLRYVRDTAKVVHTYHNHATYMTQSTQLAQRTVRKEMPNLDTLIILHARWILLFTVRHKSEQFLGEWTLQRERLWDRRSQPGLTFLCGGQDNRHRLRVDGRHHGVRLASQEGGQF